MTINAVTDFGVFDKPLRNIRMYLDGVSIRTQLIPQLVLNKNVDLEGRNEAERIILKDARPVVEGNTCLELNFELVLAIAVDTDIDVDLFGGLHEDWSDAPNLQNSHSYYPLLEITNSPWKAQLPDWRRRDDPTIRRSDIFV